MCLIVYDIGVENYYCSGNVVESGSRHGWSYVKFEDGWYYVDVTWDDGIDLILYNYYKCSDEEIYEKGHHNCKIYSFSNDTYYPNAPQ